MNYRLADLPGHGRANRDNSDDDDNDMTDRERANGGTRRQTQCGALDC